MPGTEYVWNEPDHSISVHLPLDVVSRLGLDAMEAYKAVPKRGLEIGGLLLGRTDGTVIHISDFQPVESEHRWGPAYRLSDIDLTAFDQALRQHPDAVGMYRTSTLPSAPSLEEDDVKLFRNHFAGSGKVYLLVQPKLGNAVFFITDGEALTPGHEFPFRASELPAEPTVAEATPAVVMAAKPAIPPAKSRNRTRWVQAGALIFGMVVGAAAFQAFHSAPRPAPVIRAPQPLVAPDPKPSPIPPDHVPLSVQWAGTSVMLYWNPDAPTIRNSDKGILYISDGDRQKGLMLDHGDLTSGVVSYRPQSGDVTFRLRIFNGDQTTDESIRVVGGPTASTVEPKRSPRPAEKPAAPAAQSEEQVSNQGTASRAEPVAEPAEPRPSPFTPMPKSMVAATSTAAPGPIAAGNAAAPPPTRTPAPEVVVRVEPAGRSRLSHAVSHIPLLRRLNKSQSFVAPVPTREVHPVLTARTRNTLTDNVPIDIKVTVGKTGRVEDVEMLGHAEQQPLLAELAISAARRWEFTPARMGQDKVPGEVILHFTFLMEPPPASTQR